MNIAVVTPRYAVAGVPLAQLRFARALAAMGNNVDLIIGRVDPGLVVPSSPGVTVRILNRKNVRSMMMPLWSYFRKEKVDVVFSAEDHLNAVVLVAAIASGTKAKISASSRVTPYDTYSSTPFTKRWLLKQIVRVVNWRADALTCVSSGMIKEYEEIFGPSNRVCVYNVVVDAASAIRKSEPLDHPWFANREFPVLLAAGSLAPWKGFDVLISAVAELHRRGKKVRLIILGEGPQRAALEDRVSSLSLSEFVSLPGNEENPLKYFSRADLFVLSSTVEGMSNVLVEAMMCGCTPVATDCPTGPREILQNGRFGYLTPVNDVEALASGIEKGLESPISPGELMLGVKAFEAEAVLRRHFQILELESSVGAMLECSKRVA